jgi:NADH-quinone oxidoreductase subunit C
VSDSLVDAIRRAVPRASIEVGSAQDMLTIFVDRDHIVAVCQTLRDDPTLQFALLVEVTSVDFYPAEPRYEVVYHLACLGEAYGQAQARRLRVKVRVPGADPRVPTVTSVFPGAGWPEREVYDLMGISFDGHPDLRRILTPEDWQGHPLRKDYAVQIRKDAQAWSPLQLTPEEFAANVRAAQAQADKTAGKRT